MKPAEVRFRTIAKGAFTDRDVVRMLEFLAAPDARIHFTLGDTDLI